MLPCAAAAGPIPTTPPPHHPTNPTTQAPSAVAIDALLQERASISSSSTMVDEYTSLADSVLGSLRSQRGVLKSAHKKVLDVATRLGVSTNLMRLIERRTMADKVIVYGSMVLVLMLLGLFMWMTRGRR